MGVKDLWSIVSPVCEKKSLWELEGKTVAIDLSAWVCDSQFLSAQPNTYLRNIFFRTSYLLLLGVRPVFVLEGRAPELKSNTIRRRLKPNETDDGGKSKEGKVIRSRLASLQKQCVDLLSCLGICCVRAPGEAEAYCAQLNRQGIACGVVTQDSDVFLYGAVEVYRNFQMSPTYSCDVYRMGTIESKLELTRRKMVALSLLMGCDYTCGVSKVGKETALKFVRSLPDEEIFERFSRWRTESSFSAIEKRKYISGDVQLEMAIREKALLNEDFPHLEVVEEFLRDTEDIVLDYFWQQPDMAKFVSFSVRKLGWDEEYAVKKMLPLLTRWHLVNEGAPIGTLITSIVKPRAVRSQPCYEVTWDSYSDTTVELKELVASVYPDIVAAYEESRQKPKKTTEKKPRRTRAIKDTDATTSMDKFVTKLSQTTCPASETIVIDDEDEDNPDMNLSHIISSIVNRPNSNPAVNHYHKYSKFFSED